MISARHVRLRGQGELEPLDVALVDALGAFILTPAPPFPLVGAV